MVIAVCVGSSCHLRGSYMIIQRLEELICSHRLEGKIELRANFCMENCSCGTSMRINNDDSITVKDVAHLEQVFQEQVLPRIGRSS